MNDKRFDLGRRAAARRRGEDVGLRRRRGRGWGDMAVCRDRSVGRVLVWRGLHGDKADRWAGVTRGDVARACRALACGSRLNVAGGTGEERGR